MVPDLDDEIVLSAVGQPDPRCPALEPARQTREAPKSPDWDNDLAELVNAVRDGFHAAADDKARAAICATAAQVAGLGQTRIVFSPRFRSVDDPDQCLLQRCCYLKTCKAVIMGLQSQKPTQRPLSK